ncbi:MAG: 23S rRNA (guanosine(2251)-2'-O)-methyltransferase RlmB [Acidobacteriaceae bacterium]
MAERQENLIYGIHAVEEAVRAGARRIEYVAAVKGRADAKLQRVLDACREARISVRFVEREQLDRMTGKGAVHQSVAAVTAGTAYVDLDQLLREQRGERHFLLLLDGVEDPHNLGALLRSADASGVDGVVIPERRAVGVNATVVKASAGASEYVPVAKVVNLSRVLDELKERNIWIVGLDERAETLYDAMDFTGDVAIVLGAEGAGLHDQVRKRCDFLIKIPMLGRVASLNVSVAGGVVMCEVARQRRGTSTTKARGNQGERKGLGS